MDISRFRSTGFAWRRLRPPSSTATVLFAFGLLLGGGTTNDVAAQSAPATLDAAVKIDVDGEHHCSGVLIEADMVLTAAHCMRNHVELESMQVVAGSPPQSIGIFRSKSGIAAVEHSDDDLIVIRLARSFQGIQPLGISRTAPRASTGVTRFGYGSSLAGAESAIQRSSTGTIVKLHTLRAGHPRETFLGRFGRGACPGDAGGPVLASGRLAGVVAYAALGLGGDCTASGDVVVSNLFPRLAWFDGARAELRAMQAETVTTGIDIAGTGSFMDGSAGILTFYARISNRGDKAVAPWTMAAIYASADKDHSPDDLRICRFDVPPLAVGESFHRLIGCAIDRRTFPSIAQHFIVRADDTGVLSEADEANGTRLYVPFNISP